MRFAAIICSALLFFATSVNAHGPANSGHHADGHPAGGHPNIAAAQGGGAGLTPANLGGRSGLAEKAKAVHSDHAGNTGKSDFAGLHPNAVRALNAVPGNNTAPLLSNFKGQGFTGQGIAGQGMAGQGGTAGLAHHAGELFSFLEMARNSSDPQVAARATQILQQFKQLAQQHANLTQGGSIGTSGTSANSAATNGFMPGAANHGETVHAGGHPSH